MSDKQTINKIFDKPINPYGERHFGSFNWLGLWTLYLKEVKRFWKVAMQTLAAPIITTLLFLVIFSIALGGLRPDINGVPFASFLAPGLVMMAIVQNAFANSSSSLLVAKVQGNIVDVLMPPLSPGELTIAIAMGGMTRGIFVGMGTYLGMLFIIPFEIHSIWAAIFFAFNASLLMAFIGLIGGIWAEKFDHLATITNFVITPLSFLSGTFYSVEQLPSLAYTITQFNPFFFMIDGFRYSLTGHSEGNLVAGGITLVVLNIIFWALCYILIRKGFRIKS